MKSRWTEPLIEEVGVWKFLDEPDLFMNLSLDEVYVGMKSSCYYAEFYENRYFFKSNKK